MRYVYIILAIIVFVCLFLVFGNCHKKVAVNYKFDGKSMQIVITSYSNEEVFLYAEEYFIYRKKYGDTLRLSSFQNGKKPNYISFVPVGRENYVFNFFEVKNLNKKRQNEIILEFEKMDPLLYDFSAFEKYPFFQVLEPKNKIIVEYNNTNPLEKGKYEIFLDKENHEKVVKYVLLPKEFKFLDSNEIEDSPLEFEVK